MEMDITEKRGKTVIAEVANTVAEFPYGIILGPRQSRQCMRTPAISPKSNGRERGSQTSPLKHR